MIFVTFRKFLGLKPPIAVINRKALLEKCPEVEPFDCRYLNYFNFGSDISGCF